MPMPRAIVVAGVAGSGKTTVGRLVAERNGLPFFDADDFHPPANIEKMRSGQPLDDDDRAGWLARLNELLREKSADGPLVLACSALKKSYRDRLAEGLEGEIRWAFLTGSFELVAERLERRKGHFMPPALLRSQFDIFEKPGGDSLLLDISEPPELLAERIENHYFSQKMEAELGLVGLGVMGKALARNFAGRGVRLAVFNREVPGKEEGVATDFLKKHPEVGSLGFSDLPGFVASLARPRSLFLMIPEAATDSFLVELLPHLAAGDLIIDGGNAHFRDTERRQKQASAHQIDWLGTGVSGGEEGALRGPAIMAGGSARAFSRVKKQLESIAARDPKGNPCCARVGEGGAGHFVKMTHNGIEYAEMQLLTEVYGACRDVLKMPNPAIADLLESWRDARGDSFLLEITVQILRKKEADGRSLLDVVLDEASNKGTGSWAVEAAASLGHPATMMAAALFARFVSAGKKERLRAAGLFLKSQSNPPKISPLDLKKAYQTARIINHHQGFGLLAAASDRFGWRLDLPEIARVWTGGCIIRSGLMLELRGCLRTGDGLVFHEKMRRRVAAGRPALERLCSAAVRAGLAMPCFLAAADFLNGLTTANSPANLIQAQRDLFGAHTFRRTDDPSGKSHHADWSS